MPRECSLGLFEESLILCDTVKGLIAESLAPHKAAHGDGVEFTGENAVGINSANVDLHGSVVLRRDQAIRGQAFARDVEVDNVALVVLHDGQGACEKDGAVRVAGQT